MSNAVQQPEISTLSLARRAGKLILGFDKVAEAMRGGEVRGVFYSTDLSEKSRKELCFTAQKHQMEPLPLAVTMEQVEHACGKRSGVIALSDQGFAKKLCELSRAAQLQEQSR